MGIPSIARIAIPALGVFTSVGAAVASPTHFEGRQTHPIAIISSERQVVLVDSIRGRLSVLQTSTNGSSLGSSLPVLIAEIPAGLEPVSVRVRTENEVWVVNEVSDSISIVSLSQRQVVATLPCPDEPADVVIAGDLAWASRARNALPRIFDVVQRKEIGTVPLVEVLPKLSPHGVVRTESCRESPAASWRTAGIDSASAPHLFFPEPVVGSGYSFGSRENRLPGA